MRIMAGTLFPCLVVTSRELQLQVFCIDVDDERRKEC
jgi:hypothetical protein